MGLNSGFKGLKCWTVLVQRWPGVAKPLRRLATGRMVRRSNPSWGRDSPHPSKPALGPTQPPIQYVPDPSKGLTRPGRGVDHLTLLARRFKKGYSYTSTPPLSLHGLF